MEKDLSQEHYTPSPAFSELLRYAAYGTVSPDPQDLRGVVDWRRQLDEIAQRMWFDAFMAGRGHAIKTEENRIADL